MIMPPESTGANSPSRTKERLAAALEHTLLRPDASANDIERLCTEARQYQFHCVCVNGSRVEQAYELLQESGVKVAATAGFPLGAGDPDAKRYETEVAVDQGAHEIDVVMNVGRFKDGEYAYVLRELRDVVEAADERPVKVIIEACLLNREQKITACRLVVDSGAQFVKTSTGFSTGGATVDDVRLLRESVGDRFGVKAAGGIRNARQAWALLDAGANRLGTSAAVAIMSELAAEKG